MSETYDWERLFHAYGVATDTPAHVEALMGGDEMAFSTAMEHLHSAVLHQAPSTRQRHPRLPLLHKPSRSGAAMRT
ncbi:hypothetical protein P9209_16840 [Prescottella defluvii]|nr:hypothetical protein P9209_16840 [Prescottella defluvii]